jgi:hypothetical protein
MRYQNKNIRLAIENFTSCKNNNNTILAGWDTENIYSVYSYGAHYPMFIYNAIDKQWYENKDSYIVNGRKSVTTTKHKNCTRPRVNNIIEKTNKEMFNLLCEVA